MQVRSLTRISIFASIAFILMTFQFALPIAPAFYQFDFSEVIIIIGAFAFGPWQAVGMEAMKILLHLLFAGSTTFGIGEFANFIIGCAYFLPAALIYHHKKSKQTACIALAAGIISMTLIASILNYYVLLPFYAYIMQPALSMEIIMEMGRIFHPSIHNLFSFIVLCVIPFNLIKGAMISIVVFLSYKRLSLIIKNL